MAIGKTNVQNKSTNYWQVQKIEDASFHFKKNDSGYWVNTNAATGSNNKNTAAVCKVFFRMAQTDSIAFTINQDSESGYDYGIIGALDTELTLTSTVDNTVLANFEDVSGEQTFITNIPKGEHFVYIKYRKDNSASNGTDTFQFTIAFGAEEIESDGVDVSVVTAKESDVRSPEIFVNANGEIRNGSMLTIDSLSASISSANTTDGTLKLNITPLASSSVPGFSQDYGYISGDKTVTITDSNFIANNIKSGVSIFGSEPGTYAGSSVISISDNMTMNQSSSNGFYVDCSATFTNSGITSNMKNFIIIPTIPLTYVNQTTILTYSQNLNDKKMYINTMYSPYSGDFTATFSNGKMTFLHSTQNTLIPPTGTWVGFCW